MNKIRQWLSHPEARQFIKFALVGLFNTGVDWGFYLLFNRVFHLHYLLAKAGSFCIAALSSYIMNRCWTFRSQERRVLQQSLKFLVVSVIGLGLNTGIFYLCVHLLHLFDILGLFFATGLVTFWNYFANKFWTFRDVLACPTEEANPPAAPEK